MKLVVETSPGLSAAVEEAKNELDQQQREAVEAREAADQRIMHGLDSSSDGDQPAVTG